MQSDKQRSSDPQPAIDSMLDAVGPRLRELRNRRQLKLSDVAESTGLSTSTLSRLESGLRRPTLDLLIPLAQLYRVAMDDLIQAPPTGDPRIHLKPIRRSGMVFVPLSRDNAPVQAFKVILPGRRNTQKVKQSTHGGYEWLYVLSGTVDLAIAEEITTLAEGEAAEFDTRRPHSMASGSATAAELLILFSRQGEEIHVRNS